MQEALRTADLSREALDFLQGDTPKPMPVSTTVPPPETDRESLAPTHINTPTTNPAGLFSHPISMLTEASSESFSVIRAIVSVTFRLPASLTARLTRASAERKLLHQKPFSQQDIVAEALALWLKQHGY
ncbi:MAG: hypothetical protein M1608_00410 [Candidatus Omnitrophica bacterium]|nr:hypothetical protein [Candidatus Omnitrophota bacterium]